MGTAMHSFVNTARLVALFFVLTVLNSALWAQGFATIVGTVTDPSGSAVATAKVRITDEATAAIRETTTNDQGYFVAPSLRPATYSVEIEAPGFSPAIRKHVIVQADESVTANQTLSIQQANQIVEVTAEAVTVNTSTATVSEVVDRKRVEDLPLNGRNAASLLLVVAGAIPAPGTDADQGNTKTFPSAVTVSTNGARQNQVSFRLDGANNNDLYTNVNQPFPFPDALQEFSVQTSNYSTKYGGNAGGVVNVVTKSGTNQLHGDIFEYNRNAVFNARNFFAAKRDQLKRNQYGGTVGGPVMLPRFNGKNKDFFFFGYQGTKIRNIGGTTSAYFPTAADLAGDFSAVSNASDPANPFAKATTIIDPVTGKKFDNNQISPSRFDPAAVAFTKLIPVAASGSGKTFYSIPLAQDFKEFLTRGDHTFSEKDRLALRYFYDQFNNTGFLDKTNYLANSNYSAIHSQNALLGETHLFGPTALNEFRISFSRETSNRGPAPGSTSLADLGVSLYQPAVKTLEGINVSGFFNPTQTDPADFIRNQYNLSDDFNWVHGKHSLSFGGSVIRGQVLLRNQFRTSGSYSFTADVTNDALASFLLGYVRTFTQGFGEYKDNLINTFSFYAQDDYHITRRLTLNGGLRYDPFFPWHETKDRIELFSVNAYAAGTTSSVYTNAPRGLLFPGDPGVPRWGTSASLKNIAPRVGFAYDLTGDGKTSIRGGAGVFFDSLQDGIFNNRFVDVSPFSPQFSLTQPKGTFSNPYVGFANPYPSPFPPPKNSLFPGPVLVITYDPANGGRQLTPVVYNWNLMLERQVASSWLIRGGYVGSQSRHLLESLELNPSVYTAGSKLSTDARRYFQPFGSISQASQDINSGFNSLQLTVQKRYTKGTLMVNYTWSKSIDDLPYNQGVTGVSAGNNSPIPWNFAGRHQYDTGVSEFDHTHRFVTSYVYSLPRVRSSNKVLRAVADGWQLNGIITLQSGGPLTVVAGKDQSATGIGADRANYLGGNAYGDGACSGTGPCVNYLVPTVFGLPATGTFGNVGKGSLRGPILANWDTGVFKEFTFNKESTRLQLRGEFFNTLNRANFNNPNVTQSAGGFGSITAAGDPRIGQLAAKLVF
jgi:hypothetical protein